MITDKDQNPEYDLAPVWESKDFAGHEDEVEKYFRRKTRDYIKDQTTGQILGMRTDYRGALAEHFAEMFLDDSSDDEPTSKRRAEYENARAEIQTRYGDKDPEEAERLREADLKKLRMEMAKAQVRKVLGETGKLEQIYRTRRSGAANNAKDWWREWIGLDNEEAMSREVKFYEQQRSRMRGEDVLADSGDAAGHIQRVYDETKRREIRDELESIWNENKDVDLSAIDFYDLMVEKTFREWFGETPALVEEKFKEYYKQNKDHVDAYTLKTELEDLLQNPDNYPDA